MVKGMFVNIVQSYLKQEYNKAMAEALAREFFRYESWKAGYDRYRKGCNGAIMRKDFDRNRSLWNEYRSEEFNRLGMYFGADKRE